VYIGNSQYFATGNASGNDRYLIDLQPSTVVEDYSISRFMRSHSITMLLKSDMLPVHFSRYSLVEEAIEQWRFLEQGDFDRLLT
jgi:hypothetical protein